MYHFLDRIITRIGSLFFARAGIEASRNGKVARTIISLLLTILAALILIAGIVSLVKGLFSGRMSVLSLLKHDFGYALMLLLITLVVFLAMLLLAQIVLYHARSIARDTETTYTASVIFSDILKMFGEILFLMSIASGIVVFIGSFGRFGARMLPGGLGSGNGLLMGLGALVTAPLVGALFQLLFNFFAERIRVFIDIAENTKK